MSDVTAECRSVRKLDDAINSSTPCIGHYMASAEGDASVRLTIGMLISDFDTFIDLKHRMSDSNIAEAVRGIVDEYRYLKIADLYLLFTKAKRGEYGSFYERMDTPTVMRMVRQYAEDRAYAAERMHIAEAADKRRKNSKHRGVRAKTYWPNTNA